MAQPFPTSIPGLRSPFDQVNGLVNFGRMLDKIRLAAAGKLPEGWQADRGTTMKGSYNWRGCPFLEIDCAAHGPLDPANYSSACSRSMT